MKRVSHQEDFLEYSQKFTLKCRATGGCLPLLTASDLRILGFQQDVFVAELIEFPLQVLSLPLQAVVIKF